MKNILSALYIFYDQGNIYNEIDVCWKWENIEAINVSWIAWYKNAGVMKWECYNKKHFTTLCVISNKAWNLQKKMSPCTQSIIDKGHANYSSKFFFFRSLHSAPIVLFSEGMKNGVSWYWIDQMITALFS